MSDAQMQLLQQIQATCQRTEAKVDALIEALADGDDPQPQRTLEGEDAGRERDQSQSLDPSDGK
jgi:hypothetical protein